MVGDRIPPGARIPMTTARAPKAPATATVPCRPVPAAVTAGGRA